VFYLIIALARSSELNEILTKAICISRIPVGLGSARPASQAALRNHEPFEKSGTIVTESTIVDKPVTSRYAEPMVAKYLNNQIVFLSRTVTHDQKEVVRTGDVHGQCMIAFFNRRSQKLQYDPIALRLAVQATFNKLEYSHVFFIDGGGDSLILRTEDGPSNTSPFEGGDAQMLKALYGVPNLYQGIISVGLDIHESSFQNNIELLKQRGGYYGRVNLRTGMKAPIRHSSLSLTGLFLCLHYR
jgi:hypothetical protein